MNKAKEMPTPQTECDVVILANGLYPRGEVALSILNNSKRVVCCDGAADSFTDRGGTPAAIVGDGDSLSVDSCERFADRLHFSEEQESNDLSKAFEYCVAQGLGRIVILGATGSREDHTIGNVSLVAHYAPRADVMMITDYGVFQAIDRTTSFEGYPGQQVSLFSFDAATTVRVDGLIYPPHGSHFTSWWQGTLNQSSGDEFTIITDGTVLVFREFK